MSLWDKVRGELIDIIQWTDDSSDTLVHRFERYNNQIKYGAKLTVREGQTAVFVNEGRIADVFQPGMYTLETHNLPVLSTLQGWKYGFNSPFLAEVYFCSMRQFTDLKWGTMNPIMMRDAEFGPIRLRAYGTYVVHVKDPSVLIRYGSELRRARRFPHQADFTGVRDLWPRAHQASGRKHFIAARG
jgi:membrane protease subunit (stomatin/prohibitin family)